MREVDIEDVIDTIAEFMCKGCPKEGECDGVDGFYFGVDGGNNMQLIECIKRKSKAMQRIKPPKRFEAQTCMVKCPNDKCDTIIDVEYLDGNVDDKLKKKGDSVETTCPECGTKLKIYVAKDGYLDVKEVSV